MWKLKKWRQTPILTFFSCKFSMSDLDILPIPSEKQYGFPYRSRPPLTSGSRRIHLESTRKPRWVCEKASPRRATYFAGLRMTSKLPAQPFVDNANENVNDLFTLSCDRKPGSRTRSRRNSSKLNYTYNTKYTHNTKKLKQNINRTKDTAGLSINLSSNMRGLILESSLYWYNLHSHTICSAYG